jgi:hypothetical protein
MLRRVVFVLATLTVLTLASGARADVQNGRLHRSGPPPATHWCRQGDPPLQLSRRTSCGLAAALVDRLFNGPVLGQGGVRTISVRSPVTRRSYELQLTRRGDYVTATGPNEIWIRFYYDG